MKREKILRAGTGLLIGFVNGFLGTGGGILAVPLLKRTGISQKESHINAVAVILPICLVSAVLYVVRGDVAFKDATMYIPTGILGALIGTYILKKISVIWLKRIFGALIIYAGARLLMR